MEGKAKCRRALAPTFCVVSWKKTSQQCALVQPRVAKARQRQAELPSLGDSVWCGRDVEVPAGPWGLFVSHSGEAVSGKLARVGHQGQGKNNLSPRLQQGPCKSGDEQASGPDPRALLCPCHSEGQHDA